MIDHLRRLGVTTIELLPIHGFVDDRQLVERKLCNYWGYNSISFFAPEQRYAQTTALDEFRTSVARLHDAGFEVMLDVVYNHTAEGNHLGPTLSFRGIDNASYYWLMPDNPRYYDDFTGTGNSLNLTHPRVLQMVMDSLRYWVEVCHIDGFRFDLASTLARGPHGFDRNSAFLQCDPARSGSGHRQAGRRTLGCRHRRLSGRRLSFAMVGMERPLSQHAAPLLGRRRQPDRRCQRPHDRIVRPFQP